ncbi:MAG: cell division topological specificity factor MinE [Thermoflexales bacterium]|nr:cell division topological specificity factor MinE [Thermoflexales bacterium]
MSMFKQWFGGRKSAAEAKSRLKFVLIHDRAEIAPGMLEAIRDDIIDVIADRLQIERDRVAVNIEDEGGERRLMVDIPLAPARRRQGS